MSELIFYDAWKDQLFITPSLEMAVEHYLIVYNTLEGLSYVGEL